MALAIYTSVAFYAGSNAAEIVPNAYVEVRRESDGDLAEIFEDEDGNYEIPNGGASFQADADGFFQFYVAGRRRGYIVKVTDPVTGAVRTLRNQAIGTAGQLDAGTTGGELVEAETVPVALRVLSRVVEERDGSSDELPLAADDIGKTIRATDSHVLLLDAASDLGDNWWVWVQVESGVTLELNPASPDDLDGTGALSIVGPASLRLSSDGSSLKTDGGSGYRLIKRTIYTSGSGTHTYDARTRARRAIVIGAGGGGGGVDGSGATTVATGIAGGAGALVDDFETDVPGNIGATEAYAIGASGAGGTAGANAGSAGGDTTLGALTAGGGAGGAGFAASTGDAPRPGALGGTASGGDLNINGEAGHPGHVGDGVHTGLAHGGNTIYGAGGRAVLNSDGGEGFGYGAGGSGAAVDNVTTNYAGGDGAGGLIIIEEYA